MPIAAPRTFPPTCFGANRRGLGNEVFLSQFQVDRPKTKAGQSRLDTRSSLSRVGCFAAHAQIATGNYWGNMAHHCQFGRGSSRRGALPCPQGSFQKKPIAARRRCRALHIGRILGAVGLCTVGARSPNYCRFGIALREMNGRAFGCSMTRRNYVSRTFPYLPQPGARSFQKLCRTMGTLGEYEELASC